MALTKERYEELMQIIGADVHTYPEFAEEIRNFSDLVDRKTLEMEAAGYPFKVYVNTPHNMGKKAPMFINIHGGGWWKGYLDNDVYFAAWLANAIGGVVFDIDYTTSVTAPWPVMLEQCQAAVEYALAHTEALGCDLARVSIGGYSAGGHITASLMNAYSRKGKSPFALDILCYSPLNLYVKTVDENAPEAEQRRRFRGNAMEELARGGDDALLEDIDFNVQLTPDELLANYPATLIITAGKCGFRFEDEAFGVRLAAQGVETTIKRFPGAAHGFIPHFTSYWQDGAELMVKHIVAAKRP